MNKELDYFIDRFTTHPNFHVRRAVADLELRLPILIKDEVWKVREAVAEQGYGLNILIKDEAWQVRLEVAKQGYGLDVLINDEDCDVYNTAKEKLEVNKDE